MTTLTLVHHSERWDRPNTRVRRDAKAFRQQAALVTRTEMSPESRSDMLRAKGWSFCHGEKSGENETYVEWDNSRLSLSGMPFVVPVTDQPYYRENGTQAPLNSALVTPLHVASSPRKRIALITQHMALDNTPRRADVWVDSAKGTKALIKQIRKDDPGIKIVLAADFNKNYRERDEHAQMEKYLCKPNGLTQAWDGFVPRTGGTHGGGHGQVIDGWLVDEGITVKKCWLLPDTDGSDHRPLAMTISF